MSFIGAVDITMLMTVAAPYGVLSIAGDMFCANPTVTYVIGSLSMGMRATLNRSTRFFRPLGVGKRSKRHPGVESVP